MLIEHISGSYRRQTRNRKNVMVHYDGQQDASTNQSLLDQPTQNVSQQSSNQLPSQPKSTPENSTLSRKVNAGQQAKSQHSNSSINPLTSISVPMCTASQNRILQQISASLDHALTKVNAGQTSLETLAAAICVLLLGCTNSSFFPRVS